MIKGSIRLKNIYALIRHRVGDLDLADHDLVSGLVHLGKHFLGDERLVVLIESIGDAVFVEAEYVEAAFELPFEDLFYGVIDGVVDAFDHRGEDEPGLHPVLVRIDADDEFICFSIGPAAVLLDRVECPEA